jgi:diaminopimelate decarboxylase
VAYVEGEEAPTIASGATCCSTRARARRHARVSVRAGPGDRGAAAVTVYTVGTVKDLPGIRTYVAVDGGMSDNPRPVLYGSGYETFLPRAPSRRPPRGPASSASTARAATCWCATPGCPTDVAVGDLLATPVTGAYGHSMGSNYNKVTRPPVVFVADGEARLVVRRETYDDLLATDVG